jgi:hypothetical protein
VFRIDLAEFGLGSLRVLFGREPDAGRTAVYLDVMPMSAYRQPAATNPRRWATRALGALAVAARASAIRRRRPTPRQASKNARPKSMRRLLCSEGFLS